MPHDTSVPESAPAASGVLRRRLLLVGRASGLCILYAMYPSPGMLAVARASAARRLEDLAGQPVVFGVRTSGLWGAGEGWPGFVQVAQSPGRARFIGPTAEQIPRIIARYPLLKGMEVPAQARWPGPSLATCASKLGRA